MEIRKYLKGPNQHNSVSVLVSAMSRIDLSQRGRTTCEASNRFKISSVKFLWANVTPAPLEV